MPNVGFDLRCSRHTQRIAVALVRIAFQKNISPTLGQAARFLTTGLFSATKLDLLPDD